MADGKIPMEGKIPTAVKTPTAGKTPEEQARALRQILLDNKAKDEAAKARAAAALLDATRKRSEILTARSTTAPPDSITPATVNIFKKEHEERPVFGSASTRTGNLKEGRAGLVPLEKSCAEPPSILAAATTFTAASTATAALTIPSALALFGSGHTLGNMDATTSTNMPEATATSFGMNIPSYSTNIPAATTTPFGIPSSSMKAPAATTSFSAKMPIATISSSPMPTTMSSPPISIPGLSSPSDPVTAPTPRQPSQMEQIRKLLAEYGYPPTTTPPNAPPLPSPLLARDMAPPHVEDEVKKKREEKKKKKQDEEEKKKKQEEEDEENKKQEEEKKRREAESKKQEEEKKRYEAENKRREGEEKRREAENKKREEENKKREGKNKEHQDEHGNVGPLEEGEISEGKVSSLKWPSVPAFTLTTKLGSKSAVSASMPSTPVTAGVPTSAATVKSGQYNAALFRDPILPNMAAGTGSMPPTPVTTRAASAAATTTKSGQHTTAVVSGPRYQLPSKPTAETGSIPPTPVMARASTAATTTTSSGQNKAPVPGPSWQAPPRPAAGHAKDTNSKTAQAVGQVPYCQKSHDQRRREAWQIRTAEQRAQKRHDQMEETRGNESAHGASIPKQDTLSHNNKNSASRNDPITILGRAKADATLKPTPGTTTSTNTAAPELLLLDTLLGKNVGGTIDAEMNYFLVATGYFDTARRDAVLKPYRALAAADEDRRRLIRQIEAETGFSFSGGALANLGKTAASTGGGAGVGEDSNELDVLEPKHNREPAPLSSLGVKRPRARDDHLDNDDGHHPATPARKYPRLDQHHNPGPLPNHHNSPYRRSSWHAVNSSSPPPNVRPNRPPLPPAAPRHRSGQYQRDQDWSRSPQRRRVSDRDFSPPLPEAYSRPIADRVGSRSDFDREGLPVAERQWKYRDDGYRRKSGGW